MYVQILPKSINNFLKVIESVLTFWKMLMVLTSICETRLLYYIS